MSFWSSIGGSLSSIVKIEPHKSNTKLDVEETKRKTVQNIKAFKQQQAAFSQYLRERSLHAPKMVFTIIEKRKKEIDQQFEDYKRRGV